MPNSFWLHNRYVCHILGKPCCATLIALISVGNCAMIDLSRLYGMRSHKRYAHRTKKLYVLIDGE